MRAPEPHRGGHFVPQRPLHGGGALQVRLRRGEHEERARARESREAKKVGLRKLGVDLGLAILVVKKLFGHLFWPVHSGSETLAPSQRAKPGYVRKICPDNTACQCAKPLNRANQSVVLC